MIGAVPDQLPFVLLSVCPSTGVPEMSGSTPFRRPDGRTGNVWAEVAEADPPPFEAVTTTRMVEPTSAPTSEYVEPWRRRCSRTTPPRRLQRRHW